MGTYKIVFPQGITREYFVWMSWVRLREENHIQIYRRLAPTETFFEPCGFQGVGPLATEFGEYVKIDELGKDS